MAERVLVTGAGGFIGHHLVNYLVKRGYWVRAVDIKAPLYGKSAAHDFQLLDLREAESCVQACRAIQHVYHLAADMGGIGYISGSHATICRNNSLINLHMLDAAEGSGVERFFFSSTACIYPKYRQTAAEVAPLSEASAYPADPEEGYGWEKLYAEKLCEYYWEEHGLETRVARFHNVYGPYGTFDGGREKAPAAVCRKVAAARDGAVVEVWGDGEQTRSFMYVDDCIEGVFRLMQSEHRSPLNLGSSESVTVNALFDLAAAIAGKQIVKFHDFSKPQGVRGRNSDNTKIREVLGWEPCTPLRQGLERTYRWIAQQIDAARDSEREASEDTAAELQ